MTTHAKWFVAYIAAIVPELGQAFAAHRVDKEKIGSTLESMLARETNSLQAYMASDDYQSLSKESDAATVAKAIEVTAKAIGANRQFNALNLILADHYQLHLQDNPQFQQSYMHFMDIANEAVGKLAKAIQQMPKGKQDALCQESPKLEPMIRDLATLNPQRNLTLITTPAFKKALAEWNSSPPSADDKDLAPAATNLIRARLEAVEKTGSSDFQDHFDAENKLPPGTLKALLAAYRQYQPEYFAHTDRFLELFAQKNGGPQVYYSWDEAKKIVVAAYQKLDPELSKTVKRMFDNGWIAASSEYGHNSGSAFQGLHPSQGKLSHPFISLHFDGQYDQVIRLGHEVAHALHFLAIDQKSIFADFPRRLLSESVSHFAEPLVKEEMLARARTPIQREALNNAFALTAIDKIARLPNFLFEEAIYQAIKDKNGGNLSFEEIKAIHDQHRLPYAHKVNLPFWNEAGKKILTAQWPYSEAAYVIDYFAGHAMLEAMKAAPEPFRKTFKDALAAGDSISAMQLWKDTIGKDFTLDQAFFTRELRKIDQQLLAASAALEKLPDAPTQPVGTIGFSGGIGF